MLDVGSGTGLLSLFSAQAGAKHVYAVEASKGIYELSKAIISANNMDDKITLINDEIEKIELPDDVKQVDIIVSEWMGVYLLHESMLNSVIYARDKWLKPNGLMYPSAAYLYVCPVDMSAYLDENLKYWTSYYGLNYEPLMKVFRQLLLEKPVVETITKEQLIDEEKILASLDLNTIKVQDLETFQSYDMDFIANKKCNLHGFAFWFDVIFKTDNDEIVTLGTGPTEKPTHWKQTIAFLPNALYSFLNNDKNNNDDSNELKLNDDDQFGCYVILNQDDENKRNYVIDIGVNMRCNQGEDEDDEDEEEDEHPMPCDCGSLKCQIVKAALEKYEKESSTNKHD